MNSTDIIGAGAPPPGVTPNFTHPAYIGYRVFIVAAVFPVVAAPFVVMRVYTKSLIIRRWSFEDRSSSRTLAYKEIEQTDQT